MKKTLVLSKVWRPQPEFTFAKIGKQVEVETDRLTALAETQFSSLGDWGLPNASAGPMGPQFIAIFNEVK